MWPAIIGGAAGGLIGGYFNYKAQEKANESNQGINQQNVDQQREFAQNGVRWKVADAKAAGIHPLVALGAPTASFSPSSIGVQANTAVGDSITEMGQNVSRAMASTRTQQERDLATLQIQGARLDNLSKEADVMLKQQALQRVANGGSPAFPGGDNFIDGQGNSSGPGRVSSKTMERIVSAPGAPHSEPGSTTSVGWANTHDGGLIPVPSKDIKEKTEDNFFHETAHFLRNNVAPNWGGGPKPPDASAPRGYNTWKWDASRQAYYPAIKDRDTGETVWELKRARRR